MYFNMCLSAEKMLHNIIVFIKLVNLHARLRRLAKVLIKL